MEDLFDTESAEVEAEVGVGVEIHGRRAAGTLSRLRVRRQPGQSSSCGREGNRDRVLVAGERATGTESRLPRITIILHDYNIIIPQGECKKKNVMVCKVLIWEGIKISHRVQPGQSPD